MNRKKLVVILGTLIIFSASIGITFYLKWEDRRNLKLCTDLVKILHELHSVSTQQPRNDLEFTYLLDQKIENAQLILQPWRSESNSTRRGVAESINRALLLRKQACAAFKNSQGPDDPSFVMGSVKLRESDLQLMASAWSAVKVKDGLRLSTASREQVKALVDSFFAKEEQHFQEAKSTGKIAGEVWAAMVLKGKVQGPSW